MMLIYCRSSFEKHDAPLLGGIDTDVIKLSKTLTMLSAIVCSMKTATEFTRCYDDNTTLPTTTRATLVAATSSHTSSFL